MKYRYNKNSQNSIYGDFDILFCSEELNIPSATTDDPVNESTEGDLYYNKSSGKVRIFNGITWVNVDDVTGPLQLAPNPNFPTPANNGSLSYDANTLIFNNNTNLMPIPSTIACYVNEGKFDGGTTTTSFGDVNLYTYDRLTTNALENPNIFGMPNNKVCIYAENFGSEYFNVAFPALDPNNAINGGIMTISCGYKTANCILFAISELMTFNTNYGLAYGFQVHMYKDYSSTVLIGDLANPLSFNINATFW